MNCSTNPQRESVYGGALGVLYIDIHFDVNQYYAASDEIQRQLAVGAIQTGALAAARQEGWPIEAFEHAYDCVIAKNYHNEWSWPRSPRRRPGKSVGCRFAAFMAPKSSKRIYAS